MHLNNTYREKQSIYIPPFVATLRNDCKRLRAGNMLDTLGRYNSGRKTLDLDNASGEISQEQSLPRYLTF